MRGACLTENVLYYARISCDEETYKPKLYKGIYETTFKKRYANHKNTFNAEKSKNDTNYLLNTGSCKIRTFTHGYPRA